jgi:PIN domain nuclease of toxin-antitoxin system
MSDVVLDASALLALLGEESGADEVASHLPGAAISAVNLSEVVAKLAESGLSGEEIAGAVGGLGLEVHPFDEPQAHAAGLLRPRTKSAGLGLGDRACLALAAGLGLPALTTDRSWSALRAGARVRLVR